MAEYELWDALIKFMKDYKKAYNIELSAYASDDDVVDDKVKHIDLTQTDESKQSFDVQVYIDSLKKSSK